MRKIKRLNVSLTIIFSTHSAAFPPARLPLKSFFFPPSNFLQWTVQNISHPLMFFVRLNSVARILFLMKFLSGRFRNSWSVLIFFTSWEIFLATQCIVVDARESLSMNLTLYMHCRWQSSSFGGQGITMFVKKTNILTLKFFYRFTSASMKCWTESCQLCTFLSFNTCSSKALCRRRHSPVTVHDFPFFISFLLRDISRALISQYFNDRAMLMFKARLKAN